MKVFLFGHYHTKNFGDRLLRDKALQEIISHPKVDSVSYPDYSDWVKMSKLGKILHGMREVLKNDTMILAGGGYINCNKGKLAWLKLLRYFLPCLLCLITGKPYIIVGVGVGPNLFGFGRVLSKFIFNHARIVAARDEESIQLIKEIGVKRELQKTADGALCIDYFSFYGGATTDSARKNDRLKIVFHLLLRDSEEQAVSILLDNICERYSDRADFVFFSDNGVLGREKTSFAVQQKKFEIGTVEDIEPKEVVEFLKTVDVIFTTKLHISIVGYCLDSLVFSFARHGKTKRFYRQIGKPQNCVELNAIDEKTIQSWEKQIDRLIVEKTPNYEESLRSDLIQASSENYLLVNKFLESSQSK